MDGARERLHATAIAIGGRAALIRGPSGSGKSDLALRCLGIHASSLLPEPAMLVADDQVILTRSGGEVHAEPPQNIRGKLEVRGLGIIDVPDCDTARLVLVVDLVPSGAYERIPDPGRMVTILGLNVPLIEIAPFEGSAALKLLLALRRDGHA